jgi:hypothetical protein
VVFPVPCGAYVLVLSLVLIGWRACVHRRLFGFPQPVSVIGEVENSFVIFLSFCHVWARQ